MRIVRGDGAGAALGCLTARQEALGVCSPSCLRNSMIPAAVAAAVAAVLPAVVAAGAATASAASVALFELSNHCGSRALLP